jgi:hypothetical protein
MNDDAYLLFGPNSEILIVIKGTEDELLLKIIKKILSSRDKDIKRIGEILEKDFYDRNIRNSSTARSKNTTKSSVSRRGRNPKAKNT